MEVVAEAAVSGEARVFFLGWQSWSLSGTLRLGQPGPEPRGVTVTGRTSAAWRRSPARTLLTPAGLRETASQ